PPSARRAMRRRAPPGPAGAWPPVVPRPTQRRRLGLRPCHMTHTPRSRLEPVRQRPGDRAYRAVLERLDRSIVLAHRLGGLRHRQALQEAKHDALLLLGVELFDGLEQLDVG